MPPIEVRFGTEVLNGRSTIIEMAGISGGLIFSAAFGDAEVESSPLLQLNRLVKIFKGLNRGGSRALQLTLTDHVADQREFQADPQLVYV